MPEFFKQGDTMTTAELLQLLTTLDKGIHVSEKGYGWTISTYAVDLLRKALDKLREEQGADDQP